MQLQKQRINNVKNNLKHLSKIKTLHCGQLMHFFKNIYINNVHT